MNRNVLVALELSGSSIGPVALTEGLDPIDRAVRFRATDLSDARSQYRRFRTNDDTSGRPVLVELRLHIADDSRTARAEVADAGIDLRDDLHYVGTARGLTGLMEDISDAGVADGVILMPVLTGGDDAEHLGEKMVALLQSTLLSSSFVAAPVLNPSVPH